MAFEHAVTAAILAGGGIVYVPPGTYVIGPTGNIGGRNVWIKGAGEGTRIIQSTDFTPGNALFYVGGENGGGQGGPGPKDNFRVSDMFIDCLATRPVAMAFGAGYGAPVSRNVIFERLHVKGNFGSPVDSPTNLFAFADFSVIRDCYFEPADGYSGPPMFATGIRGSHNALIGNRVNGKGLMGLAQIFSQGSDHLVADNVVYDSGGPGLQPGNVGGCALQVNPTNQTTRNLLLRGNILVAGPNTPPGTSGIACTTGSSIGVMSHLMVSDNIVDGFPRSGLLFITTGTFNDMLIQGNKFVNNGAFGIERDSAFAAANIVRLVVQNNDLSNNITGTLSLAPAGFTARNNRGYNPQGVAPIAMTASPFTHIAGESPEAVYIRNGVGTVTDISKNASSLFAAAPATVWLEPGESVVVTYLGPTGSIIMLRDRK